MSKLEPARTYSNHTATEVLRRMLDERGVWWHDTKIGKGFITVYEHDGITWIVTEHSSGRLSVKGCVKPTQGHYDGMTPEQAVAATLGHYNAGRYVGLRQGEYWERTENSNYYCGGCGWKVTDHDSYCPECGGALHEYALGTETCHITDNGPWGYPYVCSACGASFDPDVNNGELNYCPNCGKRVVEPTTNDVDVEVEQ